MKLHTITVQDLRNLAEKRPDLLSVCQEVISHSKNGATAAPTDHVYSRGRPSFALLQVKEAFEQETAVAPEPVAAE